jgi:TrmH family RNA methyltransferase
MSDLKRISSRDNLFFKSLLKLSSSARERSEVGQTLLDGTHLLRAFLDAGGKPVHLLINESAAQNPEIKDLLSACDVFPRTQLDDALFAQLSELKTPNGLLTLVDVPQPSVAPEQFLPPCRGKARMRVESRNANVSTPSLTLPLQGGGDGMSSNGESEFILLLEDIQDPGNLGSILRSAAAAGCDAVFLSAGCADAWSPRVLRAAMGGHFALTIHENSDLIAVTREFGGKILAASLQAERSLYVSNLRGKLGFAIGNEGAGLSKALQDAVQERFIIPMPGKVESLNAAAATAVCLFEAVRQRA